jgi:hypothetical protein
VTFGSVDSGPLVGVVAVAVALPDPASAPSALFSLPTVIVLEPLEPHPAAIAAASAQAATRLARACVWRSFAGTSLSLVTVAQHNVRTRTRRRWRVQAASIGHGPC